MKIRNGFVSNSSSSSFILVGIKYTIEQMESKFTELEYEDLQCTDDIDVCYNDYSGGQYLIGTFLADGDEWCDGEIDLDTIKNGYSVVKKYFPEIEEKDIKIYYGTRS